MGLNKAEQAKMREENDGKVLKALQGVGKPVGTLDVKRAAGLPEKATLLALERLMARELVLRDATIRTKLRWSLIQK